MTKADRRIIRFATTWPDDVPANERPWLVEIDVDVVDGQVECTRFAISKMGRDKPLAQGPPGKPVTSPVLRQVPLGRLVEEAVAKYRSDLERMLLDDAKATVARRALDEIANGPRKGRPALYDQEHWRRVAETYRRAGGRKPTKAVADAFGVSPSTASGWVRRCRELGLLSAAPAARKGGGR